MLNFLVADPDLQIGGPPVLPDPEIRRGGGDQFGLKIKEGRGGRPGPFPRSATDFNTSSSSSED